MILRTVSLNMHNARKYYFIWEPIRILEKPELKTLLFRLVSYIYAIRTKFSIILYLWISKASTDSLALKAQELNNSLPINLLQDKTARNEDSYIRQYSNLVSSYYI